MAGAWIRVLVLAGFLSACSDDASKIDYDSPPGDSAEATEEDAVRQPGDDCNNGDGVLDCDLNCWEADVTRLLGDGDCDQGEGGPNFDCAELDLDDGDCEDDGEDDASGDETGGTSTGGAGTISMPELLLPSWWLLSLKPMPMVRWRCSFERPT